MRKATQIIAILLIMLPFFSAHAGSSVTGKVQILYNYYLGNAQDQASNIAVVGIAGQVVNKPPCNVAEQYAFSLKDPTGRAMFAQLLHAQSSGLSVSIVGDGTCITWGNSERPLFMWVIYPVE